jgi:NADH-quinone oxidoreductase subunit A
MFADFTKIEFWPFIVYGGLAVFIAGAMIGISFLLGEKHKDRKTDEPFEAGMPPTGDARTRYPAHYYMIAMFFVIFDLDAVFLVAWAICYKEVGWAGYIGALVFTLILVAVLVYEWKSGALDFGPNGRKILKYKNKQS